MNSIIHTINSHDIQLTLRAIRYANPLPQSSLRTYLITQCVISDEIPSKLQDYHIALWLSEIITTQYNRHRSYLGLAHSQAVIGKAKLIEQLRDDYSLGNVDLESWSVLFVRYVCLNARLSNDEHAKIAGTTQRTLTRRQKSGIEQLYVQILIG